MDSKNPETVLNNFDLSDQNVTRNVNIDLADRVRDLEQQMKIVKAFLAGSNVRPGTKNEKNRVAEAVANRVDSIVGLKEAITWKSRPLQLIWIMLLLGGMAATTYYIYKNTNEFLNKESSTKVTLAKSADYEYPPLVLCPPWWFDKNHTKSLGLSSDMLIYSLGYGQLIENTLDPNGEHVADMIRFAIIERGQFTNNSQNFPNTAFLKFYSRKNFSTPFEFFKTIAVNITTVDPDYPDDVDQNASLILEKCDGCNETCPHEKALFNDAMCYIFHLNKATPNQSDELPSIRIVNYDATDGIVDKNSSDWLFDFLPNIGPNGPSVVLKPYIAYTLKLSTQRIIMLKNDTACVDTGSKPNLDYQQRLCTELCCSNETYEELNNKHFSFLGTNNINETLNIFDLAVEKYAENYMDEEEDEEGEIHRNKNFTLVVETIYNNSMNSKSNNSRNNTRSKSGPSGQQIVDCYEKCLPACDRNIYDINMEQRHLDDEKEKGKSVVEIYVRHAAIFQGGVVTWQEISAITFGEYVANVGGTLGVFLGCTVMTFAQIVLSVVDFAINRRRA